MDLSLLRQGPFIMLKINKENKINKIKRNVKIDYIYRFLSCFDITSAIWVLYLGYKAMSLTQIGLLESIFHITGFISEIPTGAMADLIGRKRLIVLGRVTALIVELPKKTLLKILVKN